MNADRSLLVGIAYARIPSPEPAASARFAEEVVGLMRAGDFALRSDDRATTLGFGAEIEPSLGVEAWDEAALEILQARLAASGFVARLADLGERRARRVEAALLARDATGNAIDIVVRPERSGRRFFPSRDAGLIGLFGAGLRSIDPKGDLRFWRALGAEVSDYVGDIAYLAIDDAHHRLALYPSHAKGPLYLAFEVATFDDVMRSQYFLGERQIRIVQGPGRQPTSGQVFLHFRGPEGLIYAYVAETGKRSDRRRPPRQYPRVAASLCAWGSQAEGAPELMP
jgi:2,3-dihydroxy-p-cumate/2,3-dihydroxybenzoate 3,4-dioxygenase